MFFKSLQSRITVLFLTLILVVQGATFAAIWSNINKNARTDILRQLVTSEGALQSVLSRYGENFTLSAGILATDYGFREAIATNDAETVISALENLDARIDAQISMLYSPELIRLYTSGEQVSTDIDAHVVKLINRLQSGGNSYTKVVFNDRPHMLVAVPVRAPITIAWIVAGFEIDQSWAERIEVLSNSDVTFVVKDKVGVWRVSGSTLAKPTSAELLKKMPASFGLQATNEELTLFDADHSVRYVPLLDSGNQNLVVVLGRSIDEALDTYISLQYNLIVLTVLGILVFIAGSIFTARRVTKPLDALVKTAEQLEKGDYSVEIKSTSNDEIGDLARTFDRMREAIGEREKSISKLAYWDELTHLPNRAFFTQQLQKLAEEFESKEETFSVLMMDINRFKHVNDVLGHAAADNLLLGVAHRLRGNVQDSRNIVARLGGDEFGIILKNTNTEEAVDIACNLQYALEVPIALSESFIDLSAGFGVANYPEHSKNVELLLSRAEIAMYSAKTSHLGVMVYQSRIDVASDENLSLASEIRQAVEQNQLVLFVQPKVNFKTGQVLSVEALVRWQHPDRGLLMPGQFIPFAEQTGNVNKITMWMLNEAAKFVADWQKEGLEVSVAVNISAKDLIDIELPSKLSTILKNYQLYANAISLEITESSIMEDPARALDTVERIARMGVKLSIDDFGTGYSSLAYLKRMPLSELKIDRSFVNNIESDRNDEMIVRSTIDLGHNLGLKVVAEGIENKQVWTLLKSMGCDLGQGYLMSKPMPAANLLVWMRNWNAQIVHAEIS